jgi:hypothetical protein
MGKTRREKTASVMIHCILLLTSEPMRNAIIVRELSVRIGFVVAQYLSSGHISFTMA